jgi:hypothetical protein
MDMWFYLYQKTYTMNISHLQFDSTYIIVFYLYVYLVFRYDAKNFGDFGQDEKDSDMPRKGT